MRLLLIIVLVLSPILSKAQKAFSDSIADFLLEKEYAIWKNTEGDTALVRLVTEKAFVYRKLEKYSDAIREIERAVTFVSVNNVSNLKWKYEALTNYYLAKEYQKAYAILQDFTYADAGTLNKRNEYLYLRWGTLIELKEWKKCKTEFLSQIDSFGLLNLKADILQLPDTILEKNPVKARRMSMLLPGSGSMYAGYPLKGAASFLINGAFATATVLLAVNALYITSFASGFLPLNKFYKGNIKLAEQLTYRKKAEKELNIKRTYYKTASYILN